MDDAKTMSKESIASSQKCLPPPDTFLDNYEGSMMNKQQVPFDSNLQANHEILYAAVGPAGNSGCENYSYHHQQHISTFGTVIPRNYSMNILIL